MSLKNIEFTPINYDLFIGVDAKTTGTIMEYYAKILSIFVDYFERRTLSVSLDNTKSRSIKTFS